MSCFFFFQARFPVVERRWQVSTMYGGAAYRVAARQIKTERTWRVWWLTWGPTCDGGWTCFISSTLLQLDRVFWRNNQEIISSVCHTENKNTLLIPESNKDKKQRNSANKDVNLTGLILKNSVCKSFLTYGTSFKTCLNDTFHSTNPLWKDQNQPPASTSKS